MQRRSPRGDEAAKLAGVSGSCSDIAGLGGIRNGYAGHPGGVAGWYAEHGAAYRNPHERAVGRALVELREKWEPFRTALDDDAARILDLCCGSGEVSLALTALGVGPSRLDAADPFTDAAFASRVGRACEPWSFLDLAAGVAEGRSWSAIVCSFALHLCPPSVLPSVAIALARTTGVLVVLSPHKRPELRMEWGWERAYSAYDVDGRVRVTGWSRGGQFCV